MWDEYEDDDGVLNFKIYTFQEFESRRRRAFEQDEEDYKKRKNGFQELDPRWRRAFEQDEEEQMERRKKIMNEQIEIFRKYTEDEACRRPVEEEMKRRKQQNLEILRGYGIDI